MMYTVIQLNISFCNIEKQLVMTSLSMNDINNIAKLSMQPTGSLVHFLVHFICQVLNDTKIVYKSRHYFLKIVLKSIIKIK